VTAWAYSNAPFVRALPFERTEAILEGMVAAFEFFGGVPKEVCWDNPGTVATPARGNEKRDAEGTVKAARASLRHAGTPGREPR